MVAVCQKHLLTPMGMRTLAPGSADYHGHCAGDQRARDMAYHQGTVWPWLIGPFVTAYVKVRGETRRGTARGGGIRRAVQSPFAQGGVGVDFGNRGWG